MALGLEARLPMLDHRLVELAFRIPGRDKIRGLSTKRVLRAAVDPFVPPYVLRRRKHGFSVPLDGWLRRELRELASDVLTDERTSQRGLFDPVVVRRLLNEHAAGRHARHTELWLLLIFEMWSRAYVDGDGPW